MFNSATTSVEDDRIVQLVGSGIGEDVDGDLAVWLVPEKEAWTPEHGLRLTEDDVYALRDVLNQALTRLEGRDQQACIRLMISRA